MKKLIILPIFMLLTLMISTVKVYATAPIVVPVPVVPVHTEDLHYPNYPISPDFSITNRINYDNVPNSIYNREVFKKIIGGNYKEDEKRRYYEDSIRYFRYLNKEDVYDSKEGKFLAGSDIDSTSILMEDNAKIFTTEGLTNIYLNIRQTSFYTYENEEDRKKLFAKMQYVEEKCNFQKMILYNKSQKTIYAFYQNELAYKSQCEPKDIITHINKSMTELQKVENKNDNKDLIKMFEIVGGVLVILMGGVAILTYKS